MPRKISTPAPELIATPDLQVFNPAEMRAAIGQLATFPKVVIHFVPEQAAPDRVIAYTGKELAAVLPYLPVTALTSAVAYDKKGVEAAYASPIFKKQYAHNGQRQPVFQTTAIVSGVYRDGAGFNYAAPEYHAGATNPRVLGYGYAGVTVSA